MVGSVGYHRVSPRGAVSRAVAAGSITASNRSWWMEPLKYLRILRRHWRLLVGLTFLGFVVGFVTTPSPKVKAAQSSQRGDTYLATHTLLASGKDSTFSLDQMAYFVTSGDVPTQVAQKLGGDPGTLVKQVRAKSNPPLGTLEINAFDDDPDRATQIADTFATELLSYLQTVSQRVAADQRNALQARLDQLGAQIDALGHPPEGSDPALVKAQRDAASQEYQKIDASIRALDTQSAKVPLLTLQTASAVPVSVTELQERLDPGTKQAQGGAKAQQSSSNTPLAISQSVGAKKQSPLVRGALGGAVGLFIAMAFAFVFSRLDPRMHTKEEAEEAFGEPVIAELPRLTRNQQHRTDVFSFDEPSSRTAEAFRALRSSILFLGVGKVDPEGHAFGEVPPLLPGDTEQPKKVVLVSSPGPSEGKTTTIANLGAVLAELGLSVLVINCDFRRPRIHQYLGGRANERRVVESEIPGVCVLNHVIEEGDDANPAEVVATQREVTRKAREMFDIILLDTAPLLTTNDVSELLPVADIVLMVAKAGKTTFEGADRAMEVLERFGAPVVGIALVGANESPTNRYYYYYRREGDGSQDRDAVENPLEMISAGAGPARGESKARSRADAALADVTAPRDAGSEADLEESSSDEEGDAG